MRVLVADPIAEKGIEKLRREIEVEVAIGLPKEELIRRIGEFDALVTRSETKATAEVIAAGRRLKVIGRAGVGVDNIDVRAATEAGILVVNVPGANTVAAAEHALGLMLALARQIPQADADLKGGQWRRTRFAGSELRGKTLAILGMGRIGTEVALRAKAFGMEVVAYDPYVSPERAETLGVCLLGLPETLARADYVSLHLAKTSETENILSRERIAMMKRGARLVNCARGGLVDEGALFAALQAGALAGAALDVFAEEPPRARNPLFDLSNVIATPHLAGSTVEAQEQNGIIVAELVLQALRGEPVLSAVNLPTVGPEEARTLRPYLEASTMLGQFGAQAWPEAVDALELSLAGDINGGSKALLTNAAIVGLLTGRLDEPINLINARPVAKKRGIEVREAATTKASEFTNLITLKLRTGKHERSVAGHVSPRGLRILAINGYQTDFFPSKWMIVVEHHDRPGMIGKVGTILGQKDINIAGMQVARLAARGDAVMVLQIDDEPGEQVLEAVRQVPGMLTARKIHLPID